MIAFLATKYAGARSFSKIILLVLSTCMLLNSCKEDEETPPPVITSFSPTSGPVGTTVTITGTNFSTTATNNNVTFNGTAATITAATATSLTVTVPAGTSTGKISVTVNEKTVSSEADFTVFNSPEITSVTPSSGLPGTSIVSQEKISMQQRAKILSNLEHLQPL